MSVCLIECEDGVYKVTPDGAVFLNSLTEPLATIGCIGVYRSGKSALLSLLLQGKVFKTSSSVNAQTRGIWLSRKSLKTESGMTMLIIDSEGGGATNANVAHDTNILALTVLLSSMVLVNTLGAISKASLAQLRMVARVSQLLTSHVGFEGDMRPALMYILRDFSLDTVDDDGKQLTENEYLEHALHKDEGLHKQISDLFPIRHCVTLPRPCTRDADLASMENLRPEFVAQLDTLRNTLMTQTPPKKISGKTLSGPQLLAVATAVCEGINSGNAIPDLKDVWDHVAQAHALQSLRNTSEEYREQLEKLGVLEHWETAAAVFRPLEMFDAQLIEPSETARADAISEFQNIYMRAHKTNRTQCSQKLDSALQEFMTSASGVVELDRIQSLVDRHRPNGLESSFSTRVLPKIFEVIQDSRYNLENSLHTATLALNGAEDRQNELVQEIEASNITLAELKSQHQKYTRDSLDSHGIANMQLVQKHQQVAEELAVTHAELTEATSNLEEIKNEQNEIILHNQELEKCLEQSTENVMTLKLEIKEKASLLERKNRLVKNLEIQIKTLTHSLQDDLQSLKKRTLSAESNATINEQKLQANSLAREHERAQLDDMEKQNDILMEQAKTQQTESQIALTAHNGEIIRLMTEIRVMQAKLESGERASKRQRSTASTVEMAVELKLLRKRASEHGNEVERLRQQIEDEAKSRRQAELALLRANLN
jgi:hypothetical protein